MSLQAGTRLGPYDILELIGAGGMGEVYRARDTRLGRVVAVKTLPAGPAADPARLDAFEREARVVAALSHPNVLAIYDVGTHEGTAYLVTELLEGQTLRARMAAGLLPVRKALDLAIQIARGLAAAHEKGIVHRDIKPENIFITSDGQAKILDFGIAQLADAAWPGYSGATVTRTASSIASVQGTVGYMAPEQARGLPSDHRADLFAFGCVLYEMLSGRRAFSGESLADLVSAVLTKDPPPLDQAGHGIPPALQEFVNRCLEKEPQERFSSAHDLALALQSISGGVQPAAPRTRSWFARPVLVAAAAIVAVVTGTVVLLWTVSSKTVLSFAPRDWVLVADLDNQTGDRVFDKSLNTAFIVSLEQSTHANVFPQSRLAAALKRMGKAEAPAITEPLGREICVRENVRGLIGTTISKIGSSYSLTARLIDPRTGDTVRSYMESARTPDDVLSAVGSLATAIRRDLGESLASIQVSNKSLPQVTTTSVEALSMYAEGIVLWGKGKYDQALQMYQSALKADPDFAMAHAAVGAAFYSHIYNRPVDGKAHLERAMQLSDRTTRREAQIIEIQYENGLGHFDRLRNLYDIYLKTYPDDSRTRYNYGNVLRDNGQYNEAVTQYLEVLRVVPSDASALINLATCYSSLEQPQEALKAYARAFELEPDWVTSGNLNHEYGFAWVRAGDVAKAEAIFNKGAASSNKPLSMRSLALLDMYRGKYRRAVARLHDAILLNVADKAPLSEARNYLFMATAMQALGDGKGRLAALDEAARCVRQTAGQVWIVARIGTEYARAGVVVKAAAMAEKAQREAEPTNPQQASEIHRLEGEMDIARGAGARGLAALLIADRERHWALTQESLARAYRLTNSTDKAVEANDGVLAMQDGSLGWEAQQGWLDAHYWAGVLHKQRGQPEKGLSPLDKLLAVWNDGDPDLPMRRRAEQLRRELTSPAR